MGEQDLRDQLIKHIDEALAMEQNVLRMLDSMAENTEDEAFKEDIRLHTVETEGQIDRLRERLDAHGGSPSMVREAGGIAQALMKSAVDAVRSEKTARNARDGYATEHLEIASYELLERVAMRAGDEETAAVARQNRSEEESMARRFEQNWDRFADIALDEARVRD